MTTALAVSAPIAQVSTTGKLAAEIIAEHEAVGHAATSALAHARRAGDLLLQAKATLPHGAWLPWLGEHCPTISERTVQGYMKIASRWTELTDGADPQRVADLPIREALGLLAEPQRPRQIHSSGDFAWYSPAEYVEAARSVMGAIDLDPASCVEANAVVQANRIFTIDDDGLTQPWSGRCWLNPPYVNATITAFVAKLVDSYRAGAVTEAVVLSNNATDTRWFHDLAAAATSICFPLGRVRYWRSDTTETSSALQGQTVFYLGDNVARFEAVFGALGLVGTLRPAAQLREGAA